MNGQVLRADGEDLIASLNKAKCSFIVLDPAQMSGAWMVCKHAFDSYKMYTTYVDIQSKRIPSMTRAFIIKPCGSEDSLLETLNKEEKLIYEAGFPQDTCAIFTTSGSTGYSKLVPHTHESLLTFAKMVHEMLDLSPGIKFFDSSPFGWLGGFPIFSIFSGCIRVALDESLSEPPEKTAFIWKVICKEKADCALLLPSIMETVLEQKRMSSISESHILSKIATGGQPITQQNIAVVAELAESITAVYASTEIGLASGVTIYPTNISRFQDDMAGYPSTGVKLKIVDKHLQSVQSLTRGEILVHSPTLTTGYIGADASAQEDFLPDGWFRTGDIGFLREDGCLFVEGRSSDAIMHGAYILYPTWLEQMLIKCPGVKDVVIVPVPDNILHHEICACVHVDETADVQPTADDIVNFCQNGTSIKACNS